MMSMSRMSPKARGFTRLHMSAIMSLPQISAAVSQYNVPLKELQTRYPNKLLVVGVAIYKDFTTDAGAAKKLLIVQRSAAEDSFPLMYEIPGGHAEPEDSTLLDTVIRETLEETGLAVKKVVEEFTGFEYDNSKGESTVQLNFIVEVDGASEVTLNPEEHQSYSWIDRGTDLTAFNVTGSMLKVINDALAYTI